MHKHQYVTEQTQNAFLNMHETLRGITHTKNSVQSLKMKIFQRHWSQIKSKYLQMSNGKIHCHNKGFQLQAWELLNNYHIKQKSTLALHII